MPLDDNVKIYSWGIRIYLDTVESQDTDIGLYTSGTSEFRWIECLLSGTTLTWKDGFIIKDSFGSIESEADLRWGGGVEEIGGFKVSVDNTGDGGDPFSKKLQDLELDLKGLRCEVWRFEGYSNPTEVCKYFGEIDEISWTDTKFNILIVSTQYKRVSNLATLVDGVEDGNYPDAENDLIGKTVPITIGEFNGLNDRNLARFQRVSNKEEIYDLQDWLAPGLTPITKYFPIVKTSDVSSDIASNANSGQKNVTVQAGEGSLFSVGDTVTIRDDVASEQNVIASIATDTLTMEDNLTNTYTTANQGAVDQNPSLTYQIVVAVGGSTSTFPYEAPPDNMYVKVTDGTGEGQIRAITQWKSQSFRRLTFDIADYFEDILVPSGTDQSWVAFFIMSRDYEADTWPCKDFIDSDGNQKTQAIELYTHDDDDGFIRVPEYGYDVDTSDADNNKIQIDPKVFDNNTDVLNSYLISSCIDVKRYSDQSTLENWLNTTDDGDDGSTFNKITDGIYSNNGSLDVVTYTELDELGGDVTGDPTKAIDKKIGTIVKHTYQSTTNSANYWHCIEFKLPSYPEKFTFNNIYLGLKVDTESVISAGVAASNFKLRIKYKKWYGVASLIVSKDSKDDRFVTENAMDELDSLPDFYYDPNADTDSKNFYYQYDGSHKLYGYTAFELSDIDSKAKYEQIESIMIMLRRNTGVSAGNDTSRIWIYDSAIIFKKEADIKSEIYTPFQGRIYTDTWGSRRTATDMIDYPHDVLEHIIRLQNWSDTSTAETWGKAYADSPLIDTSAVEGGFGHPSLSSITGLNCARQILSESEAYTDKLKESLCRDFFICSFNKHSATYAGYEALSFLPLEFDEKGYTIDAATITLSKLINVKSIEMQSQEDVFCEPLIRYKRNYANDEFEGLIQIKNVAASSYDASYVIGYTGESAEYIWRLAKALWNFYRHVEEPPNELIESEWIRSEEAALVKMQSWLRWMGTIYTGGDISTQSNYKVEPPKRITFDMPYQLAESYFISQRVKIQIPHYTNNVAVESILESISHNINNNVTTIRAILLGETTAIEYFIKDTYGVGVTPDWKDTWEEYAIHGEGSDVKDSY